MTLREWGAEEVKPLYQPYSLRDTLQAYSFSWQYWGGSCGLLEAGGCVVEACEDGDRVRLRAFCGEEPSGDPIRSAAEALGVWEDTRPFLERAARDPLLEGFAATMPGYRVRGASVWAALLIAVCQQNASFRQGWGMLYRLHLLASKRLQLPDNRVYLATPEPSALDEKVLREAGLGYRARIVLEAVRQGIPDCGSVENLYGVKGVGRYTLNLVRVLACRDYTRPPIDRWLVQLAHRAYGVEAKIRVVEREFVKRFNGYAGIASIATTIAFDAQPLRRALERLEKGLKRPGLDKPSPITLWRYTPLVLEPRRVQGLITPQRLRRSSPGTF